MNKNDDFSNEFIVLVCFVQFIFPWDFLHDTNIRI